MRIFEEYFVRNKITDVPLVHHCKFGSLILKSTDVKSQSRFMLVNIKWQDHDHHPGQYIFEISFHGIRAS